MNLIVEKLKGFVQNLKEEGKPERVIINAIKEQLQYLILDFIYNHPSYSHLIMYGGTLLRIGYELPRMSEDLDFQTDQKFDFKKFKNDLIAHFKNHYGVEIEITTRTERLTGTDVATIKFPFLSELETGHPWSKLWVKFDVNYFSHAGNFSTEIIRKTKDTYSFSIKTYPLSTLMASKVAAVLQRNQREFGKETANHEPRDIYDLMWYMSKKIIPNLDYLKAKSVDVKNICDLFDELELRVLNVDNRFFGERLASLYHNRYEYDEWYHNWRRRFQDFRNQYQIYRVKKLESVHFGIDFSSNNRFFIFLFETEEYGKIVKIVCSLSEYWFLFSDLKVSGAHRRKEIESKVANPAKMKDLDYEYLGLLYTKIEDFLKHNDQIVTQADITTKLIRATGDNLNVKREVLLDKRLLEKINFEDLI